MAGRKALLKKVFRVVIAPVIRGLGLLFYDRRYLTGRHFDKSLAGYLMVWKGIWLQKVLGFNRKAPWPMGPFSHISNPKNLEFHPDDLNNFWTFGCYFQNIDAKIRIGRGTYIAPNVGLITSNHDPDDLEKHLPGQDVVLGEKCWIGMNSVILPGVILGPNTVVAAGAVVTKSFPEGNVVLGGVPAKLIRSTRITPEEQATLEA
jgi:hypothetical protein